MSPSVNSPEWVPLGAIEGSKRAQKRRLRVNFGRPRPDQSNMRRGLAACAQAMVTSPAAGHVEAVLLGMPVRIAFASASAEAPLREACMAWRGARDRSAAPLAIDLREEAGFAAHEASLIYVAGDRMTLSGAGFKAVADAATRTAICTLSSELLAWPDALLAHVLEPLGLFLATRSGRVPIHASGVQLDDLAILFSGPSGSGKSSLAMAAARASLQVLSEDTIYVQREPRLAIWGWQGPIHLLAKDAGAAPGPLRLRNGRVKVALEPRAISRARQPATAATLCVLRHGERASLQPISQACALEGLGPLEPGFDLLADEIHEARRVLLREGAWRLTLSPDPDEAIAVLAANLARL